MNKEMKREADKRKARKPGRSPQDAGTPVEKAIGNRLRAYYDEVAREPIPDRFVELLRRLDDQEPKS